MIARHLCDKSSFPGIQIYQWYKHSGGGQRCQGRWVETITIKEWQAGTNVGGHMRNEQYTMTEPVSGA